MSATSNSNISYALVFNKVDSTKYQITDPDQLSIASKNINPTEPKCISRLSVFWKIFLEILFSI